jgi:hypothetical protein
MTSPDSPQHITPSSPEHTQEYESLVEKIASFVVADYLANQARQSQIQEAIDIVAALQMQSV